MALKDRRQEILRYIGDHAQFTADNKALFQIFEGTLRPHIEAAMRASVNQKYFEKIRHRLVDINLLTKVVDKLSKAYATAPMRKAKDNGQEQFVKFYEDAFDLNSSMDAADEYANLFRGYALEPYITQDDEGEFVPALNVIPFDRFLVMPGENPQNALKVETFIKFMGKVWVTDKYGKRVRREVYYTYTAEEFDALDSQGETYLPALDGNNGLNPYGRIPFVYARRARQSLLPAIDTGLYSMTVSVPVMLSDTSGALMFQCFSITYAVDVDAENINMSPNAFINFKSDATSGKNPQIGTLKPEVDSDKVIAFVKSLIYFWLDTRGIKAGSTGQLSGQTDMAGIAKIVDEADTSQAVKKNMVAFKREEKELWQLTRVMHNFWVSAGILKGLPEIPKDFSVTTEFDEPQPIIDRGAQVQAIVLEVDNHLTDLETAIKELHPDWDQDKVDKLLAEAGKAATVNVPFMNQGAANNGQGATIAGEVPGTGASAGPGGPQGKASPGRAPAAQNPVPTAP